MGGSVPRNGMRRMGEGSSGKERDASEHHKGREAIDREREAAPRLLVVAYAGDVIPFGASFPGAEGGPRGDISRGRRKV